MKFILIIFFSHYLKKYFEGNDYILSNKFTTISFYSIMLVKSSFEKVVFAYHGGGGGICPGPPAPQAFTHTHSTIIRKPTCTHTKQIILKNEKERMKLIRKKSKINQFIYNYHYF